jgi:hypothetical protein
MIAWSSYHVLSQTWCPFGGKKELLGGSSFVEKMRLLPFISYLTQLLSQSAAAIGIQAKKSRA